MKRIGIWIDSREALVATIGDTGITYDRIYSGVDSKPRFKGETSRKSKRMLGFDYETSQQAHVNEEMRRYIKTIAEYPGQSAAQLYITGQGQVRLALEKELMKNKRVQIIKNDPLGNLSLNQKLERFRKFFESEKN
jgi:hypothetical protein